MDNRFIVVAEHQGFNYFLQMRNVLNWQFVNNHIKVFKTLDTARKNADKVLARFKAKSVHVIRIDEDDYISTSSMDRYYGTEKDVYSNRK